MSKTTRATDKCSSAEIEEAWDEEIRRRLDEVDSGKVKPISAEEVFKRIKTRLDALV